MLHGKVGTPFRGEPKPDGAVGSAGYIPGIPRLGVPHSQESDAGLGVANPGNVRPGDDATALPASLALAATWSADLGCNRSGAVIGNEARRKGLNVMLAGGMKLARDPRNGRNFEYFGEDPLLAGTLAGDAVRGIQNQNVISTVKHFALNDQETGRLPPDARIAQDALRESDLLAFEIAIERGKPGAVMCAYNRVNGEFCLRQRLAAESRSEGRLEVPRLGDVGLGRRARRRLRAQGPRSGVRRANRQPRILRRAAEACGERRRRARRPDLGHGAPRAALDVRGGPFDPPSDKGAIDFDVHARDVREVAEQAIVVLRNERATLPLARATKRIAVIGGYAEFGVSRWRLVARDSGRRTSAARAARRRRPVRVLARDQRATVVAAARNPRARERGQRSGVQRRPLSARGRATRRDRGRRDRVRAAMDDGELRLARPHAAARAGRAHQRRRGRESAHGGRARDGRARADAVAQQGSGRSRRVVSRPARRRCDRERSIRSRGAGAGACPSRSRRRRRSCLDRRSQASGLPETLPVTVDYREGADVGYRDFARRSQKPLFAFGYGQSYTTFAYGALEASGTTDLAVSFTATNTGMRPGYAVPQIYLTAAPGATDRRLLGWVKALLAPGETKRFTVPVDLRLLAKYSTQARGWQVAAGKYEIALGASAEDLVARTEHELRARKLDP